MEHIFFYIGTLPKSVQANDIKSNIPSLIAKQQSQFNPTGKDSDPKNIDIVEHAYVDAEPNVWLVYAKWKIK